ncbi:hypothetical protein D6C93_04180 [Aureobasidium pullulans]|nr:hypothetical protein D6C93_04180 [Aureobasidium pullulans]
MARLEQFENMERFPFMALPPELRLMVYDFALEDIKKYTEPRAHLKQRAGSKVPQNPVALLWVSRCIRNEVLYPDTSALDLSVSIHRQKANWTAEFTGKLSYKYLAFAPANPMKRGQSSPRWMGIEDRNAHQLIRLVRYAVFSLKLRQHCFLVVTLTFGDAHDPGPQSPPNVYGSKTESYVIRRSPESVTKSAKRKKQHRNTPVT